MQQNRFFVRGSKQAASEFAAKVFLEAFWNSTGNFLFGTATGQTPVLTYQNFAKIHRDKAEGEPEDFADFLRFIQLDNYVSPGSSADNLPWYSYERELSESIWRVPNSGMYIPREYTGNPEKEAEEYRKLRQAQLNWANTYMQILGIGDEDGHIAFNMPGTPFDSTVHVVDLNQETITANANKFFGGDKSLVPKRAITTGIGDILKANIIVFEALGSKKASIVKKAFFEEPTEQVPASALQYYGGLLFVVLDDEAAAEIPKEAFTPMEEIDIAKTVSDFLN